MTALADYIAALERTAGEAERTVTFRGGAFDVDAGQHDADLLRALAKALSEGQLGRRFVGPHGETVILEADENPQAPLVLVISLPDTEQAWKEER